MANIQQLQQRTWILTQMGNTEIKTTPNERNIASLQFSADNRISGADGCNRIMGSYTVGRDTLTLSQLVPPEWPVSITVLFLTVPRSAGKSDALPSVW